MLLRQEIDDRVDVLSVTGDIGAQDAPEIVAAVERVAGRHCGGVLIDLRDVTAVAPDAADALRDLTVSRPGRAQASLDLSGASPEVQQALAGVALTDLRTARGLREVVLIEHSDRGPAQARRIVTACAAQLGLAEEGDDLVLLVSEMVTNAVRHGAPPIELQVSADDRTVVLAVADGSPLHPYPREAGTDAEGGRGMALVDLLTEEHGVRPDPPGKTVWASVRRRAGADEQAADGS